MSENKHGGRRKGAGRPKKDIKRTLRAVCLFDEEWLLIKNKAKKRKMPVREYIYWLAENDKP